MRSRNENVFEMFQKISNSELDFTKIEDIVAAVKKISRELEGSASTFSGKHSMPNLMSVSSRNGLFMRSFEGMARPEEFSRPRSLQLNQESQGLEPFNSQMLESIGQPEGMKTVANSNLSVSKAFGFYMKFYSVIEKKYFF